MISIKTNCDVCGEVLVHPTDLAILWGDTEAPDRYEVSCPHCKTKTVHPMSQRVFDVLAASGVRVRFTAPPSLAEVDRFASWLETADDLVRFLR